MFFQGRDYIKKQTGLCQKGIQVTKLSTYQLGNNGKDCTYILTLNDSCAVQEEVVSRTTALGVEEGGKWVINKVEY